MPLSPQDYLMNVPSPPQGVMGGVMQGLSLANIMEQRELAKQRAAREEQLFGQRMAAGEQTMRAQRQAMALRTRQAEQQRRAAIELRKDLSDLATKENPTDRDYNTLLLKHPQMSNVLKQSNEMLGEGEKKRITNDSIQIYSALENNRPDLAENILTEKLTAAENAGNEKQIAVLKSTLTTLRTSPEAAKTTAGLMLSSLLGAENFAEQFSKLRETARAEKLAPTELKKAKAEANKAIMTSPIPLTKDAEKLINESVISATKTMTVAKQYDKLAGDLEKKIKAAGVVGVTVEAVKKILGTEEQVTALRQEYRRLRNSAVLDMLPPGVASDKDIEIAMGAFPSDVSNPNLIASFMRGMAKLQRYDSKMNNEKADWISRVGNLGSTTNDITIEDETISKGTRFTEHITNKLFGGKMRLCPTGLNTCHECEWFDSACEHKEGEQ